MSDIGEKIRSLIKVLLEYADKLDELHRTVNKVNVAGNMASAVGSAGTLVGIATAPFTGGASLALTVASLAGGFATGGASICRHATEILVMKAIYNTLKEFMKDIDAPDLRLKYGKLAVSIGGILMKMGRLISEGRSFSSSKEFMTPDMETVIKITKTGTGLHVIATGREITEVAFTVTGKEAAKVLADATGEEAVKLVEKVTRKVVLKASVELAGKKTAWVTAKVIGKAGQTARNTKSATGFSAQRAAQGSQNTGKIFGRAVALFSFTLNAYGVAAAAYQLITNRGSEGGNYLRELAGQLEEFASKP